MPKRDGNGVCRRLHNEELHSLYRSPNVVSVIKSKRLRWAWNLTKTKEGTGVFEILRGIPTGEIPLRRPRRRWWTILERILKKYEIRGIVLIQHRIGIIREPL